MELLKVASRPSRLPPPDHRWQEIVAYARQNPAPKRMAHKDPLMREGYRFLRHWERTPAAGVMKLVKKFPAITNAYLRYGGPEHRKTLLEAGLTAGAGDQALAADHGVAAEEIAAYAHLFFDVRERLMDPEWVLTELWPQLFNRDPDTDDHDRICRMLGYCGGRQVLMDYSGYGRFSAAGETFFQPDFQDRFKAHLGQILRFFSTVRSAVAAQLLEPVGNLRAMLAELRSNEPVPLADFLDALHVAARKTVSEYADKVPASSNPDAGLAIQRPVEP